MRAFILLAYSFCSLLPSLQAAYPNGYKYRRKITWKENQITVGSTSVTNAHYFEGTYSYLSLIGSGGELETGYDFKFETLAGSDIPYYCLTHNTSTGAIKCYKRFTYSATTDTETYIYTGNASISSTLQSAHNTFQDSVAAYHFGDGSTLTLTDLTSNAFNLTNSGSVTAATGQVYGTSSYPGGTIATLTNAGGSALNTSDWTVELWWRRNSGTALTSIPIITHTGLSGTQGHYFLWLDPADNKLKIDLPWVAAAVVTSVSTFSGTGTWYHIAASKTGTTYRIYVNGTQDASATAAGAIATGTLTIGGFHPTGHYGPESIDELRIYGSALTAEAIQLSYNATKTGHDIYTIGTRETAVFIPKPPPVVID